MINKGLKNKVVLSVFAGAMLFSCAASAAEIEIDGTGLAGSPDDSSWTDSKGLIKYKIALFEGAEEGYRLENANDKLVLKNFNNRYLDAYNVSRVEDCPYLGCVIGGADDADNDVATAASNNTVTVKNSDYVQYVYGGASGKYAASGNTVNIYDSSVGACIGGNGDVVENNKVYIKDSDIYANIFGGIGNSVNGNHIIIEDSTHWTEQLFAAWTEKEACNNIVEIKGKSNVENITLRAYHSYNEDVKHSGNTLKLNDFSGKTNMIYSFDVFDFANLDFSKDTILTTNAVFGLENSEIKISSIKNYENLKVGETTVTLIKETEEMDHDGSLWKEAFANIKDGYQTTTNVGVASVVTSDIAKNDEEKTITATVAKIERNEQTNLVAENRAVAAAFVNQGTDLIADSLDTLSRDGKYGVKTFAAVHGNRSKYDVNSDIKINGWSTIVGVGAENEHNGGDFSWGVFYENGSGNYRTYNDFNNEFFRGDGSLVYNGGGIAARYENSHGVYTEGSLRAGMLKSEMTDALSDGENKYGYESETAYYGAHIGVGKIFSLGDDSDLDVYGKFFHTYTEGDSFNVAGDEFEFDSINSDRLRIGARVTSNKENKFSTYYGLAYEYEFNGDAEMRAAGMKAPTQSLQGSSVMAEIGLNYQPTPDSPWSFDLNMRGYAGERQGGSFNVQATYTF